jgi:hypothetical protein
MSRLRALSLLVPIVLATLPPRALSAQRADAATSFSLAVRPVSPAVGDRDTSRYAVRMTPIAPAARADEQGKPSVVGSIVRAAVGIGTGALVGGWLGYFGAQVGNSDWDRISSAEKTSLRQSYTVVGLGVGGLLGYLARPKPHVSRLPQPFNIPARSGRQLIAATELRRSIATNALEAVELGRPEWLKQQHDDEAKQGATPRTGPVESISLVVYVGDERVGGLETLRDIAIPEVTELRFYDARDARHRWGMEHRYGAIEIVPVGTASTATASVPANSAVPAK